MKKISLFLVLTLCTALLVVPAYQMEAEAVAGDLFDAVETLYAPDFATLTEDPTDGGKIVGNPNTPAIASDGSLQLTSVSSAHSAWTIYLNPTMNPLGVNSAGCVYCIDFDLKKPNTTTASYFQFGATSGDPITRHYIHNDSKVVANSFTNIKFIFDGEASSRPWYLLYDNVLVSSGSTARNLQIFRMVNNASSYSYYIDNFSVYKIAKADLQDAAAFWAIDDSEILGENTSADAITTDLALTDDVTWTSSNENIISNDGVVSRDMVWPSTTVTLTAKSGDKFSKDFTFKVLRKDLPTTEGMTGDYYVYDDFETSTVATNGIKIKNGSGEIRNSKFYFTHTGTSGETNFEYYFKSEKTSTSTIAGGSDVFAVEFDIKKELEDSDDRSQYYIRVLSYDGNRYYAQTYVKGSSSETLGLSGKSYYDSSVNHFKYIIDTVNKTYSLYVNGMLEVYEAAKNTTENPYVHLQAIRVVNQTPGSTISLDNVKVYKLSEKTYETGYNNYGITKGGILEETVDAAGLYVGHISCYTTGLTEAPVEADLPVCYMAKYNGNELVEVVPCSAKLITYSAENGIYGWWYPNAHVNVEDAEVGNTSVKAFVWDGLTPVDKHIVANAINQ